MIIIREDTEDKKIDIAKAKNRMSDYSTPHNLYVSSRTYKNDFHKNEKRKRLFKNIGKLAAHTIATGAAIRSGHGAMDTLKKLALYNAPAKYIGNSIGYVANRATSKFYNKYKNNKNILNRVVDTAKEIY